MNILIISEFIAPCNAVASIRWTKLGKYLAKDHDCTVDILTNEKDFHSSGLLATRSAFDKTLSADLTWFDTVHTFKDGAIVKGTNLVRNALWDRMHQKERPSQTNVALPKTHRSPKASTTIINSIYPLFLKLREKTMVRNALKEQIDWNRYDVIISSFSPKWTHLIANRIQQRNPRIVWIADYRDALVYSSDTSTASNREFASRVTASANCITAVSQPTLDNLFLPTKTNTLVLPNGFDPEESACRKRIRTDKFLITYTGTLYRNGDSISDLTPLLQALEQLIAASKISASDIEFVYCGMSESLFVEQVARFPSIPWKSMGQLSRSEALALQSRSSLLALCVWNTATSQGVVTGKLFEYLTSSVPIACLCSGTIPHSQIKGMIEASNAGFCFEEASRGTDLPKLASFVQNAYDQWMSTGMTKADANEGFIRSYGYDKLASNLFEELERLQWKKGLRECGPLKAPMQDVEPCQENDRSTLDSLF